MPSVQLFSGADTDCVDYAAEIGVPLSSMGGVKQADLD